MLGKGEHPFSNKYGATAEAVLTDFLSTEAIVNTPVEELIAFISSRSHGRISDPKQTAYLLQKAANASYRLFPAAALSSRPKSQSPRRHPAGRVKESAA